MTKLLEVRSAPTTAVNARSARKNQNAANGVPPSAPNLAQREPLVRSEHRPRAHPGSGTRASSAAVFVPRGSDPSVVPWSMANRVAQ